MSTDISLTYPRIVRVLVQGPPGPPGPPGPEGDITPEMEDLLAQTEAAATSAADAASTAIAESDEAQSAAAGAEASEDATQILHDDVMAAKAEVDQDAADVANAVAWVQANATGMFADTTAGLAGTAVGDFFSVPGAPGTPNTFVILYRHDAGPVATEIDRAPNAAAVTGLFDRTDMEQRDRETSYATAVVKPRDAFKNPPLVVWSDGRGVGAIQNDGRMIIAGLDERGDTRPTRDAYAPSPHALSIDPNGRIFLSVDDEGRFDLAALTMRGIGSAWPQALRKDGQGRIFERYDQDGSLLIALKFDDESAGAVRDAYPYRFGFQDTAQLTNFAVKPDGTIYVALAPESLDELNLAATSPQDAMAYVAGSPGSRKAWLWQEGAPADIWIGSEFEITDILNLWQSASEVVLLAEIATGKQMVRVNIAPDSSFGPAVTLVHLVLMTGQSLIIGWNNDPVATPGVLNQGRVAMFNGGVRFLGTSQGPEDVDTLIDRPKLDDFVDLEEADTGTASQSIAATYGNGLAASLSESIGLAFACGGIGATGYTQRKKGEAPYRNLILAVERGLTIANRHGMDLIVPAVAIMDGESDRHAYNKAQWMAVLAEQRADFDADIKARTSQAEDVAIITDQMGYEISDIPLAQLQAALDDSAHFICVGPKYHLPPDDVVHLTAVGYAIRGHEFARAHRRKFVDGANPLPLYIASAVLAGNEITLTWGGDFTGPVVIDTSAVTDPGDRGLKFAQTGGNSVTITAITMLGASQTRVTLSAAPTGTNRKILCARHPDIAQIGPTQGCRSCFRDSSSDTCIVGGVTYNLYRWAAHWEINVT